MLHDIIDEYFNLEFSSQDEAIYAAREKVTRLIEAVKRGESTVEMLDEAISEYAYQAEKKAIQWTYTRCALVIFDCMTGPTGDYSA